jgi:xanthine dehydrogenase accessory factor
VPSDRELWDFVAARLGRDETVMLLIVASSSGSSPGRAGYKMAIAENGELCGSIGGGVMEVELVERAKRGDLTAVVNQVHRRNADNASGMICSGEQTVIFKQLLPCDLPSVEQIVASWYRASSRMTVTPDGFFVVDGDVGEGGDIVFESLGETDFRYSERLARHPHLYIIGGGHCALALSEVMCRLDFTIHILDDRPDLNTLAKNTFADDIKIIRDYSTVADHLHSGDDVYVVVMTLGYSSDNTVIEKLLGRKFLYFGVLGSKAKMSTLMRELQAAGYDREALARIHTPIGVPINSRTPEEIAVSIAAEIIAVKNA